MCGPQRECHGPCTPTLPVQFTSSHDIHHRERELVDGWMVGGRGTPRESERGKMGRQMHTHTHTHSCNYTGKLIDCSAIVGARGGTAGPIDR